MMNLFSPEIIAYKLIVSYTKLVTGSRAFASPLNTRRKNTRIVQDALSFVPGWMLCDYCSPAPHPLRSTRLGTPDDGAVLYHYRHLS